MTNTDPIKVYELAKELGIDSISLLDRLRGLNITVKSHMSELKAEEAQAARDALTGKKGDSAGAKGAKKPAAPRTRKKAVEDATAASPAPAAPSEARPPVTEARPAATAGSAATGAETPVARKAAPAESRPAAASTTAVDSSPARKAASPIIRRRTPGEGAAASGAAPGAGAPGSHAASPTPHSPSDPSDFTGFEGQSFESPASVEGGSAEEAAGFEASASSPSAEDPAAAGPSGVATPSSIAPFNRPSAPKRSFLKIVEAAAPPPRPMIRPAAPAAPGGPTRGLSPRAGITTQDKDGFRTIKITKGDLDQMAEEEAAKKRGGGREPGIRPEDVRFADYRKKEMVFLPKKKKFPVGKNVSRTVMTEMSAHKKVVEVHETISVQDLASQLSEKGIDVVRKLMALGQMVKINSTLDFDTAVLVSQEFGYEARNVAYQESSVLAQDADTEEGLVPRPPVVTIMGHVDHGKTTLLDSLRSANVAAGEAGGITQHIGAYTVEVGGRLITFIDTPGHEAFGVMRARGANVTDIVVLVVSADDGVMPQTREALAHAKAAKVPIIVAVNKIDKPGAQPDKIKQSLAELDLLAEDWGGDTMFIPVSALKKTNLDKLLEGILLQAEVLDLKANPAARAEGSVLEGKLERGRGPVATVLINRGTLRVGDPIVAGIYPGRVKAMVDSRGANVAEATPGIAVEVLGLEGIPAAGEEFNSPADDSGARELAQHRIDRARAKSAASQQKITLDMLFSKVSTGETKELSVVVKADVFGSVEAIRESLLKCSTEKVKLRVLHAAPGAITESDVLLATASNAIIIGFNVRPETKARQMAEAEHIEVRTYSIIYELIDDMKNAMAGLLEKKKIEKFLGRAEVRQTFNVPKIGTIAGSYVIDGKILRGASVRLLRDGKIIFTGKMSSLKRFKDDAKDVAQGFECGIGIENYNDLKVGDLIEAFQIDMIAATLEDMGVPLSSLPPPKETAPPPSSGSSSPGITPGRSQPNA